VLVLPFIVRIGVSELGLKIVILGPANCVGRALALHEMRVVLATLVRQFEMEFAPGFKEDDWTNHLLDKFVLLYGSLPLVMHSRA
jgi:cytochrome P450